MKWFRLYTEILDDPKIQKLSDAQFRDFIYMMCLACEVEKDGLIPYSKDEIAWRLRRDPVTLCDGLVTLGKCHIVTDNGEGIHFLHWKKRQYSSDSSAERTRRWRDRQKSVTSPKRHMKRHSDVLEQNRDREEQNILPPISPLGSFQNVKLTEEQIQKLNTQFGEKSAKDRIERLSEYIASKGKKYKSHYATILTWARKEGWTDGKQQTNKRNYNVFIDPLPEEDGTGGETSS